MIFIYNIYTDGSTLGNGKNNSYGGWALYCVETSYSESNYENDGNATNNREELLAILAAIKYALNIYKNEISAKFIIHTDSQYSIDCITKWAHNWKNNGWRNTNGEIVANKELIQEAFSLLVFKSDIISFVKVKGHDGDKYNELVDKKAVSMSQLGKSLKEEARKTK